jgi:HicB_like antitoxin of bacterial toxin-antitoxin system
MEEARRMAAEALALHIEGMVEDGQEIPQPSSLDAVAADPAMQGGTFMVSAEPAAEETVRVNITARPSQLEAIDRLAGKTGLTRSAYIWYSPHSAACGRTGKKRTRAVSRRQGRGKAVCSTLNVGAT